ncbi:hypothetical protein [Celerinatantimonas sp. YJH-8]|uniref:hypothetical protein n=1 Tax=Celerinatantimonas sp. YJH-8 TaxID=3228714 RepID=UPI0038C84381
MNINVTLPNIVPLAVNPPTEDARRDNIQRPQIIPPKEMAANPSGAQVGGHGDQARTASHKLATPTASHSTQKQHPRIEEKTQQQEEHSFSGKEQQEQQGDPNDNRRLPLSNVSLDALLARAKSSQLRDRDYYHRAPPGAPSSPEEVKAMRFRNQVIAHRYQSSYQLPAQPGLSVTI